MAKSISARVGGKTWRMREATLYLNDWYQGSGGFNHPVLLLVFAAKDPDFPDEDSLVRVGINFQRNKPTESGFMAGQGVTGRMDTARSWCASYGGHIALDGDNVRLELGRKIPKPCMADRVREKASLMISEAIETYNLHALSSCQCEQAVLAIEALGGRVGELYEPGEGISGPTRYMRKWAAVDSGVEFGANEALALKAKLESA